MKARWILGLGWMLMTPWVLSAQTALSVEANALWRVDLRTHEVEWLADLGTPDPFFECADLAVSPTGAIRCIDLDQLYSIGPGLTEAVAPLPDDGGFPRALTFDSAGRLWFAGGDSPVLWRLDPATGAVLESVPLALEGITVEALGALGERLFAFTSGPFAEPGRLEEIDPQSGDFLSAIEIGSFEIYNPADAAFDAEGSLWLTSYVAGIITGAVRIDYFRIRLEPFSAERTFSGAFFVGDPLYLNIADVEVSGTLVEVPAAGPAGLALLTLLLVGAAWVALRRGSL